MWYNISMKRTKLHLEQPNMKANMAGTVSTLEIHLKDMQTFTFNKVKYYYTQQTMHTPYQIARCEIAGNPAKFVMYLIHTFVQSFQIINFVCFYDTGAIDPVWSYVGSYPCGNKVLHVFKTFGLEPPTLTNKKQ